MESWLRPWLEKSSAQRDGHYTLGNLFLLQVPYSYPRIHTSVSFSLGCSRPGRSAGLHNQQWLSTWLGFYISDIPSSPFSLAIVHTSTHTRTYTVSNFASYCWASRRMYLGLTAAAATRNKEEPTNQPVGCEWYQSSLKRDWCQRNRKKLETTYVRTWTPWSRPENNEWDGEKSEATERTHERTPLLSRSTFHGEQEGDWGPWLVEWVGLTLIRNNFLEKKRRH